MLFCCRFGEFYCYLYGTGLFLCRPGTVPRCSLPSCSTTCPVPVFHNSSQRPEQSLQNRTAGSCDCMSVPCQLRRPSGCLVCSDSSHVQLDLSVWVWGCVTRARAVFSVWGTQLFQEESYAISLSLSASQMEMGVCRNRARASGWLPCLPAAFLIVLQHRLTDTKKMYSSKMRALRLQQRKCSQVKWGLSVWTNCAACVGWLSTSV